MVNLKGKQFMYLYTHIGSSSFKNKKKTINEGYSVMEIEPR